MLVIEISVKVEISVWILVYYSIVTVNQRTVRSCEGVGGSVEHIDVVVISSKFGCEQIQ